MKSLTRREALAAAGKAAAVTVVAGSFVELAFGENGVLSAQAAQTPSTALNAIAGVDRVVMNHGKTYLSGWVGYGDPPRRGRQGGGRGQSAPALPPPPAGPAPTAMWSKVSGPGTVTFADGATPLPGGTVMLNGTLATFSISTLSAGTHAITATYNGDARFTTSTSSAVNQTVQ